MNAEEWRPVAGYPDYEASSAGRVRRVAHVLSPIAEDGRTHVKLSGGARHQVGRVVLLAFAGPCPDGMECCHINDDPADNRPSNLRWGTRADNAADAVRNGKNHGRIGERHPCSKLRKADVLYIRSTEGRAAKRSALARRFGVSRQAIAQVQNGRTWVQAVTVRQPSEGADA